MDDGLPGTPGDDPELHILLYGVENRGGQHQSVLTCLTVKDRRKSAKGKASRRWGRGGGKGRGDGWEEDLHIIIYSQPIVKNNENIR